MAFATWVGRTAEPKLVLMMEQLMNQVLSAVMAQNTSMSLTLVVVFGTVDRGINRLEMVG
ncbi:hypothetical protein J1614_004968 [Plenodomus biglobosus]|nr:hypothetical protein J1614_004968 [Plenodomus biglobosus]